MVINGIDLAGLAHDVEQVSYPPVVPRRIVHIDADFLAYQVSFEKPEDPKSLDDMKHNCKVAVDTLRQMAGAERVHLHLTPGTSDKGDRFNIAVLKEYQGNRVDKPKPRYLHIMRQHMSTAFPATMHVQCEADDGMSSAQYKAIQEGKESLSIIASKDKDLCMVPGYALEWDTGAISHVQDYGSIELKKTKSGNKLTGRGHKFFWAQMLMGDTADNISGLPALAPSMRVRTGQMTAADKKLHAKLATSVNGLDLVRWEAAYASMAPAKVGAVTTFELLDPIKNNKDAFEFVKECYKALDGSFVNYRDGTSIPWQTAFISEAQLLWMRRDKHNANCVKQWLKEVYN